MSSDAALATRAGVAMLAAGGNAAEAAITAAFTLAVVYPTAGNLGGGGFAVTYQGGQTRALDFRETAPAAANRSLFVGPDGRSNGASLKGRKAAGVPGSVAGLYELHRALHQTKSWAEVLAPAIAFAEQGFTVDEAFLKTLEAGAERLRADPTSKALYFPGDAPPPLGSTFKNPELAAALHRIAEQGPAGFYEGKTAEAIAIDMRQNDGLVTREDLRAYRAKWREPLVFTYRGKTVASMPPPSSGGVTLAMIANLLAPYDLAKEGASSPQGVHQVVEAMRRAFAARNARLGDPDFVKNPMEELLSSGWADAQRASIEPSRATPSSAIPSATASASGPHTTHLAVVDGAGGAVSLTTTINWFFGTGITVPGAGFVLNNEMDDFAVAPGTANGFGLVQGEPNALAPGKRMLSSMSPTLVFASDGAGPPRVELAVGAAGGPTIITATFEVISNVLDFGMDPVAALAAPRFHMQHLPDVVAFERLGLSGALREGLGAMGYAFAEREHLADVSAVGRVPGGWVAAGEPRRAGALGAGF